MIKSRAWDADDTMVIEASALGKTGSAPTAHGLLTTNGRASNSGSTIGTHSFSLMSMARTILKKYKSEINM